MLVIVKAIEGAKARPANPKGLISIIEKMSVHETLISVFMNAILAILSA